MRRQRDESDSLELLLDTICNVFGGVMLMAILIVLQTQASVSDLSSPSEPTPQVEEDTALSARVERARQELEEALEEERELVASQDPQTREVLERRAEFLAAIEEAQSRLSEERTGLEAVRERAAGWAEESRDLEDSLAAAEREVEEAEARLGVIRRQNRRQVRLPMRHDQRAPLQRSILVAGDTVYGLPEHCRSSSVDGFPNATRYRPAPGRGVGLGEGAPASRVLGLLDSCRPTTHFVSFWVSDTDQSFETFQRARAAVLERGFEYSVAPYDAGEGLIVFPGRPQAE